MRMKIFVLCMLCALLLGMLTLGVSAQTYPDYLANVNDVDNLLTDEDEQQINAALAQAREAAGIPVCAYVFAAQGEKYIGDQFLAEHGLSDDDALVLLIVTVGSYQVNYNIYTYGDAYLKINEKEIGYILDDSTVYYNLKDGNIAEGLCAYAELSAQAYAGRLGVSWKLILIVALIAGAIAGGSSAAAIAASYKRKNPSQSYPLDRFAKLDLKHERDREIGKFVTTTIISSGSSGGRGGGGRTGGGGGHRGGR